MRRILKKGCSVEREESKQFDQGKVVDLSCWGKSWYFYRAY